MNRMSSYARPFFVGAVVAAQGMMSSSAVTASCEGSVVFSRKPFKGGVKVNQKQITPVPSIALPENSIEQAQFVVDSILKPGQTRTDAHQKRAVPLVKQLENMRAELKKKVAELESVCEKDPSNEKAAVVLGDQIEKIRIDILDICNRLQRLWDDDGVNGNAFSEEKLAAGGARVEVQNNESSVSHAQKKAKIKRAFAELNDLRKALQKARNEWNNPMASEGKPIPALGERVKTLRAALENVRRKCEDIRGLRKTIGSGIQTMEEERTEIIAASMKEINEIYNDLLIAELNTKSSELSQVYDAWFQVIGEKDEPVKLKSAQKAMESLKAITKESTEFEGKNEELKSLLARRVEDLEKIEKLMTLPSEQVEEDIRKAQQRAYVFYTEVAKGVGYTTIGAVAAVAVMYFRG